MVVRLGHRLGGPVLVDGADLELLEIAPVFVRARGLSLGLVRGQLMVLVAHRLGQSPRVVLVTLLLAARDGTGAAQTTVTGLSSKRPMSLTSASMAVWAASSSGASGSSLTLSLPPARESFQTASSSPSRTTAGSIIPPLRGLILSWCCGERNSRPS